uniref:HMDH n=1 Tax=Arundo donax TaxID=35708 RepID=A0A0A9GR21_ARUDO
MGSRSTGSTTRPFSASAASCRWGTCSCPWASWPVLLDGRQLYVPMATTEGYLIASTTAVARPLLSPAAPSVVLRDKTMRAPAVSSRLPAVPLRSRPSWRTPPTSTP